MNKAIATLSALLITITTMYAQPLNDDCNGIIHLGESPVCEPTVYTNINATPSIIDAMNNIPSCFNGGTVQNDVWFSFTVPSNSSIVDFELTVEGTSGSSGLVMPQVAVYRGSCEFGGLAELSCGSAVINANSINVELIGLDLGVTYFIRINDFSASGTPNWGDFTVCIEEYVPVFNIDEVNDLIFCEGTLYDSGGPDGDYDNGEFNSVTICPNEFHQCIFVNISNYNIETNFDYLNFYAGSSITDPQIISLTGSGSDIEVQATSSCITIQFTSDGSSTQSGFELNWECSADTCTIPPLITCDEPAVIPGLPFVSEDLSTCLAGNAVQVSPCNNATFVSGNDYIFTYESPGDECIMVDITNSNEQTGVAVFDDCPNLATDCIAVSGGGFGQIDPTINAAYLSEPGTYYILVANQNCTSFDISVDTITCPITFPSAANCEDALSISGCSNLTPSLLNLEQGIRRPDIFPKRG